MKKILSSIILLLITTNISFAKEIKRIRLSIPLGSSANSDFSKTLKKEAIVSNSPMGIGINYVNSWGFGFTSLTNKVVLESNSTHERIGKTDYLDLSYLFRKKSFINYTIGIGHLISGNQTIINDTSKNESKKAIGYSIFHQIGFSGKKWEILIGIRDIKTQYTHDFSATGGKNKNVFNFNFTYTTVGLGYKF